MQMKVGESMSLETLQSIRKTEEEAAAVRAEAQERARALTEAAAKEGEDAYAAADAALRKESAAKLKDAESAAKAMLDKAQREGEEEGRACAEQAQLHKKTATKMIIREIMEKCQ